MSFKAQIGAGVGNFIEWYDIGIYGYLAVTIIPLYLLKMPQGFSTGAE